MAIIGLGTDIIEISRIDSLLEKYADKFAARLLHPNEMEEYTNKSAKSDWGKARFLAKRFAAKEAYSKALGTGIAKGVNFTDIEVTHTDQGQPQVISHASALQQEQQQGVTARYLSISDEAHYAVATVILEKRE